jgi:prepilin signal peptidase PulO-like enzyme (type II secretory pathway)
MKILISVVFFAIVTSLVMAGYFMLKREAKDRSRNMAFALTIRIGLSVALFATILLLWWLGNIKPTGRFPVQ